MDRQTIWWFVSILIFGFATYLFIAFKPVFTPSFSAFVFGFLAGSLSYIIGKTLQLTHKQLINVPVIFVNSVLLIPLPEEILFRFAIITLLFNNSFLGVFVSIIIWVILHVVYESLGSPVKVRYYWATQGLIDITLSGIIFATVYILSDFNLFAPWIAHTLHNFLVWFSIAFPAKASGVSIQQLMGKVATLRFSLINLFSRFAPKDNFIGIYLKLYRM